MAAKAKNMNARGDARLEAALPPLGAVVALLVPVELEVVLDDEDRVVVELDVPVEEEPEVVEVELPDAVDDTVPEVEDALAEEAEEDEVEPVPPATANWTL